MRDRFRTKIAAFAICLLLSGLILSGAQPTDISTAKAKAETLSVETPPQECARCAASCKSWVDKCQEGGQYACYKAAACLCKCNLDAGGCGSSKEALKECYEENEKAAKELETPEQR